MVQVGKGEIERHFEQTRCTCETRVAGIFRLYELKLENYALIFLQARNQKSEDIAFPGCQLFY